MSATALTRRERLGRRLALIVFSAVVGGFTLINTVGIIRQVWFTAPTVQAEDCRKGVVGLMTAVRRARAAAAAEVQGERAALESFRRALAPEWGSRKALDDQCSGDPSAARGLREVDRLRYAEEHGVRSDAVEVAALRRRVQQLEQELAGPP